MRKYIPFLILALGISGCATPKIRRDSASRADQQWKLARATALLQEGNQSAAAQVLTHISAEPAMSGVTDEALFRLGLLHLRPDLGAEGMTETQKDMARIVKEFPSGAWTPLATRLADLIAAAQEALKRENRLKKSNSSARKTAG